MNGWNPMPQRVLIKSFPRIHITLIDLAGATSRKYGGVGFALAAFPIEVEATLSVGNELTFHQEVEKRDERDVREFLERLKTELDAHFSIRVHSLPPQHVGLGSKTALLLAVGAACNALRSNPLKVSELKNISGRGATSGIGVNAFFHGGVIVDLGHPKSSRVCFVPSSAQQVSMTPPIGIRLPFPQEWQVHLFLPEGRRYAGGDEVNFFQRNTPISGDEALRVLAAVYHGIVPAFLETDHILLRCVLAEVQAIGFKQREIQGQSASIRHLLERLSSEDYVAAGMSSMGPLIYTIVLADKEASMARLGTAIQSDGLATYLGCFNGRNLGHEIRGAHNA
jgi:beta-ribofuranosylaminobenzene 5'-phosphate synthase